MDVKYGGYTGGGIHYRGCTFITGGWHPPVLHPLQGGVPSSLGVCIPGHMCTGGGIHYRGCTFITGGMASTSAASTTGGCTFITRGVVQGMCPHKFYLGTCTCTCIKLLKQYTA